MVRNTSPRVALLAGSSRVALLAALALVSGPSLGDDECGPVAPGGTAVCTSAGNSYPTGIRYVTPGVSVVVDGTAVAPITITTTGQSGVHVETAAPSNADTISVTTTTDVAITTQGEKNYGVSAIHGGLGHIEISAAGGSIATSGRSAFGVVGFHDGLGDVSIESSVIVTTGDEWAHGLLGFVRNTNSTGAIDVRATGGTITTVKSNAAGAKGLSHGLGAVTVRSDADITTGGSKGHGLHGLIDTTSSDAALIVEALGGSIVTAGEEAHGVYGEHLGTGSILVTADADITTEGEKAHGLHAEAKNASHAKAVTVNMHGGTVTTKGNKAYGVSGLRGGTGDLSVEAVGTIQTGSRGVSAVHEGTAGNVRVASSADITTTGPKFSHAILGYVNRTGPGDVSLDVTGGDLTTTGNQSHGVYAIQRGSGDIVTQSKATVTTQGNEARGVYGISTNATNIGTVSLDVNGTIATAGEKAHGVEAKHEGLAGDAFLNFDGAITTTGDGAQGLRGRIGQGTVHVAMTGGTIHTSGNIGDGFEADGIRTVTLRAPSAGALGKVADIAVAGDVEVSGANAAALRVYAIDNTGAAPPNGGAHALASVDLQAGSRLHAAQGPAVSEGVSTSGTPVPIDTTLTLAGTVSTGVAGSVAIDLSTGDDAATLLPTAAVTGGINGGAGLDTLTFTGIAGTGATFGVDALRNFESLAKTGAGRWTLSGDGSGTTAPFAHGDGALIVNADMGASAFTTQAGTLLGGTGTLGALDAAGTVAPGNSIGTLSVLGNAVFRDGSTFALEVAPSGSSDRLAVGGSATISMTGTTITAAGIPLTGYPATQTFTVLTAVGGVTGQFATVTDTLPDIDLVAVYEPNAVKLSYVKAAPPPPPPPPPPPSPPVVTPPSPPPPSPPVVTPPTTPPTAPPGEPTQPPGTPPTQPPVEPSNPPSPPAEPPETPTEPSEPPAPPSPPVAPPTTPIVAPAPVVGFTDKAVFATMAPGALMPVRLFSGALSRRLRTRASERIGSPEPVISGRSSAGTRFDAAFDLARSNGFEAFTMALGERGTVGEEEDRIGYSYEAAGMAFGLDTVASTGAGDLFIGAAAGWVVDRIDLASGKARVRTPMIGVQSALSTSDLLVSGAISAGRTDAELRRDITVDSVRLSGFAQTQGTVASATTTLSYDIAPRLGLADLADGVDLMVRPYASLHAAWSRIDGYTETGLGILNLSAADTTTTEIAVEAGLRLALDAGNVGAMRYRPSLMAGYRHTTRRGDDPIVTLPLAGASFATNLARQDRHKAVLGAGLEAGSDRLELSAQYEATVGARTATHSGQIALSLRF